ncbi:MAG: type II toxin-antitoxin system HicB family antitoxin [Gammaproteobacteria bacterium]|nr:type II toxin-antitoxin system HicB family antitoxin [Gammaproteobacteria bacterium]
MTVPEYSFEIKPLTEEDGGGWLIAFPDLPGCMSDGETPEEALKNGMDALKCWIAANEEEGRPIPKPGTSTSGKFAARIPKSLQARLIARARQEGVSVNVLVMAFIAESLGRHEQAQPGFVVNARP